MDATILDEGTRGDTRVVHLKLQPVIGSPIFLVLLESPDAKGRRTVWTRPSFERSESQELYLQLVGDLLEVG